jgi:hypothetical protein
MSGLKDFTTLAPAYRAIIRKAATYTVLATDEYVQINGTYTMTLPALDSLQGTTYHKKAFYFENIHATSDATIQPGTSAVTGTADTIEGKALYTLKPNEIIVISGSEAGTDWKIGSPTPQPALTRVYWSVVVAHNGSAAVNVFDANGAPANIDVTAVLFQVVTACSGVLNVFQDGTSSIATISVTTANAAGAVMAPAVTLANKAVAKGTAMTVALTSAGTAGGAGNVIIFGTMQQYV